jgi:hypothetical protein
VPHIPDFLWSFVGSLNFMRLSLKERRTRSPVQSCVQEIRGISLVFGEMWDSTALTPKLFTPNQQLRSTFVSPTSREKRARYGAPMFVYRQGLCSSSPHAPSEVPWFFPFIPACDRSAVNWNTILLPPNTRITMLRSSPATARQVGICGSELRSCDE